MKLRLLFLILPLFAGTLAAQSPAKILKQAEKALGGVKQLQSVRSVIKKGNIKRVSDGVEGQYLYQTEAPNLFNFRYDLNGLEREIAYNGRSGWLRSSLNGLKTLTGSTVTDLQAMAQYRNRLWLDAKRAKARLVLGGQSTIDGRAATVVTLTTQKGSALKLYFDALTGLPVRDEMQNDGLIQRTDYGDYREVGCIKQAFFNRITIDGEVFEIRFNEIKVNQPISRSQFDFPTTAGKEIPDVPSLLKELQANEDRVENILDTYSFVQRSTRRELGKDGVLRDKESETDQLSFYKGKRIRRRIEKNGKPLTADEQSKEDKETAKQVDEIEKQIAKKEAAGNNSQSDESRRISVAEMLRASTLSNPRRERFRGRDVIVFDFEPNPAFDYKNAKSVLRFFGKTAGTMWIDENDKQVARLEAFLADSYKIGGGMVAKLKKGASFTFEQERVNDEIWLPSVADFNFSVRVFLLKGIDLNQVIRSYDYRRFTTEVKDAKVNPPTQP